MRLASFTSSDMCTAASAPMKGRIDEVMPMRVLPPMLPQPPLSEKVVNTVWASAMGDTTQRVTMIPIQEKQWIMTTMPSMKGRSLANTTLTRTENADTAKVSIVPCQGSET